MITIELTEEEAGVFRKFREHQNDFQLLYDAGVFLIRNGKAVLNFDADGTLTEIKRDDTLFKRGFPMLHIVKFDL